MTVVNVVGAAEQEGQAARWRGPRRAVAGARRKLNGRPICLRSAVFCPTCMASVVLLFLSCCFAMYYRPLSTNHALRVAPRKRSARTIWPDRFRKSTPSRFLALGRAGRGPLPADLRRFRRAVERWAGSFAGRGRRRNGGYRQAQSIYIGKMVRRIQVVLLIEIECEASAGQQ